MSEHHHGELPGPALIVSMAGGLLAQATGSPNVGMAGLIVAITGLLMAIFRFYDKREDGKARDAKIEEQGRKIEAQDRKMAEQELHLQQARDGRHADANRFNGMLLEGQAREISRDIKIANLEGRLGITDKSHAKAINANADNIVAVAAQAGIELPAVSPHLEPSNGNGHPEPDREPSPRR